MYTRMHFDAAASSSLNKLKPKATILYLLRVYILVIALVMNTSYLVSCNVISIFINIDAFIAKYAVTLSLHEYASNYIY